jgi:hypothetical protein
MPNAEWRRRNGVEGQGMFEFGMRNAEVRRGKSNHECRKANDLSRERLGPYLTEQFGKFGKSINLVKKSRSYAWRRHVELDPKPSRHSPHEQVNRPHDARAGEKRSQNPPKHVSIRPR